MRVGKKQNDIFDKPKERKKIRFFYTPIIFLAMIVLAIVFFLVTIDPAAKGRSTPKPPQMRKLAAKIGRLETEVHEKQDELIKLSKLYSDRTGELPPELKGLGLSDDERKIFENKILNEKDASIKSLLKDILKKNREISGLKAEIAKYEASLPISHIVTEGESHYQIAMDFLIKEKKVEKERASRLVEEILLFDPLIPGFRVWNFYAGDEFGTFVTQGSAAISPTELRKAPQKNPDDITNRAIDEEKRLTAKIKKLRKEKDRLESQIKDLQDEKQKMEKNLNELDKQNLEKERLLNSLFYMVDLEENLLKKGIIKEKRVLGIKLSSPKLKEISPADYDKKIDLRTDEIIEIYANQINLDEIKKVTLYPGFYKKDVDYKVEIEEDKKKAIVTILDTEKFRRDRVVISVE
jgi:predicted RNase H-like nuclease (RuvC/YqgF family)